MTIRRKVIICIIHVTHVCAKNFNKIRDIYLKFMARRVAEIFLSVLTN